MIRCDLGVDLKFVILLAASCFRVNFAIAVFLDWARVIAAMVCISPPGKTFDFGVFLLLFGLCPALVAISSHVRPVFNIDLGLIKTMDWLGQYLVRPQF